MHLLISGTAVERIVRHRFKTVLRSDAGVGYCLGRAFWHQGIMSEALSAVISFLFKETGRSG
ncbi:MAG: GNAT family N-acetyltransferase [Oscillospiraceae bacterium]|nr:GNAT family N-acetyltransferase [Oscillospiraceae bacterium]